jgi:uncharacterized protein YbaR (Trm112 family)
MFRENNSHRQETLFNTRSSMNTKTQAKLSASWAPLFYKHVFCAIDEKIFAELYCADNGRYNFPVNILVALEFIKHWKDFTDDELLEQVAFNYQVASAIGMHTLGEIDISRRTFYHFRSRVYQYSLEHAGEDDLIFKQFVRLNEGLLNATGVKTDEQRTDSTSVLSNMQKAGRLALAFDVLFHAVKACPTEILTGSLRTILTPTAKTEMLFRTKSSQTAGRLTELLNLAGELLELIPNEFLNNYREIRILDRFLREQAIYNETEKRWYPIKSNEISASSLQSAHDQDATYRKKSGKGQSGYVVNFTETASADNPLQLITDYVLEPNIVSDTEIIEDRLPGIKKRTDVEELYMDGGYYGQNTIECAQELEVKNNYTDMTGSKPKGDRIPLDEFAIDEHQIILSCPKEQQAQDANYDEGQKVLVAHFDSLQCQQCELCDKCPVKIKKNGDAIVRITLKSLVAAETRRLLESKDRANAVSHRAAIEGTNSAIKRGQGMAKLRVRETFKCKVVVGMKVVGHNIQQVFRYMIKMAKSDLKFTEDQSAQLAI